MSAPAKRAGLYGRISLDRFGESESTERQLADCEQEASRRGWHVVDRYVDRDVSAFRENVRRPEYTRLLHDLRSGQIDAVVVWKLDRLTRQGMRGIHEFTEVLGDNVLVSVTEPFLDTTSPMGRAVLVLIASLAEQESENTSLRVRRAQREAARKGLPHKGGYRAFGMTRDGSVIEAEAGVIREAVGRVSAGESLRAVAQDFNKRGITTSTGGQWRSRTLGQMLRSPRLAGLRTYEGELIQGSWERIISKDEHLRLLSILEKSLGDRRDANRAHLLTGVIQCGLCGRPMRHMHFRMRNGRKFARYQCLPQPGHGNCGRIAITSPSTDERVASELLDHLAAGQPEPDTSQGGLEHQLAEDHQALTELVHERFIARTIPQDAFVAARETLEARISDVERRLAAIRRQEEELALRLPLGNRAALQHWWDAATPEQRQAVTRERILRVVVTPAVRRGGNTFDPTRLHVEFRRDAQDRECAEHKEGRT